MGRGHREEAYSDWLEWIIAQSDALEVLSVFGVSDPEVVLACKGCPVTVVREKSVLYGHEGSSGRLDLEIRLGDAVLLVVEVKLGSAEDADTKKGAGYCRSIEEQQEYERLKRYIILVVDADDEDYCGFKPWLWEDACIELRRIAVRLYKQGLYLRAATTPRSLRRLNRIFSTLR